MRKQISKRLILLLAGLSVTAIAVADQHAQHDMSHEAHEMAAPVSGDDAGGLQIKSMGTLMVDGGWARATIGKGRVSAAYLTIKNHGEEADALVAVSTPVADRAELHTHIMDGDMMRMRQVKAVEVNPGEPAVFRPGGNHIMLLDLKQPLKAGERIPLTLVFEKGGTIDTDVMIKGLNESIGQGKCGAHMEHGHMDHGMKHEMEHNH